MTRSFWRSVTARSLLSCVPKPIFWMLFPLMVLFSGMAHGEPEEVGYWYSGFDTPMSTIAGLTDWAQDINYVYGITTIICILIFVAVAVPVVIVIWKFRAKPDEDPHTVPKQFHGHAVLEFTWTVIPCILLVFIAVPTWKVIFKQAEAPPPDALKVKVVGHQWWWEFQYPDLGVTTANEIHLPENTRVYFEITSDDVIHSFWIPQFGGKVDAFPGEVNAMNFTTPKLTADAPEGGRYFQGQCVELCGLSHALMRFQAVVHTKEKFQQWVREYNKPPVVETSQQARGEQVFAQCIACHTIYGTPSADIPGKKIGPNLTNFGSRAYLAAGILRNTRENLETWLRDPPAIKPGSLMPNLQLSDEDIDAVASYLLQTTAKRTAKM